VITDDGEEGKAEFVKIVRIVSVVKWRWNTRIEVRLRATRKRQTIKEREEELE